MKLSIVIPTRGRIPALERAIRALDAQNLPTSDFHTVITVDGPGDGERAAIDRLRPKGRVRVIDGPAVGPASARNRTLVALEAQTVLFLNDDVVPDPDLAATHIRAHGELAAPAMVVGSAPWRIADPVRVVDRMVRETSMVFFFDQMTGDRARNPDHDWGFRHAWTLNLSMPVEALHAAGGFDPGLRYPVYEDVEMAYRVVDRTGMPVVFRSECRVVHDHRYEVRHLIRREALLGHQALRLAEVNPACARTIFGYLHTDAERIGGARAQVRTNAAGALEALAAFRASAPLPGASRSAQEIKAIYEHSWKPVRAYLRAMGWTAAADGATAPEAMDRAERWMTGEGAAHAA